MIAVLGSNRDNRMNSNSIAPGLLEKKYVNK